MGVGSTCELACELKILQVTQRRSRSFKITPMSRACVTYYWLFIVGLNMCLSCKLTVNDIYSVEI